MKNRLTTKDKFFVLIIFLYITYTIFPLFADITGLPVYIPALSTTVALLFLYPDAFMSVSTKWFITYISVMILYVVLEKPIFVNGVSQSLSPLYRIIIESAWTLPNISIMNVILYKRDIRFFRLIGYGSIALLVVSFLYISPLLVSYSNILREDFEILGDVRPMGLPDYTLMHAYTLMVLPLCVLVKKTKIKVRLMYLSILLLFAYVITQTAVSTSLVVMSLGVVFAFFFNIKNMFRSFLFLGLLLFIAYVLSVSSFYLDLIESLMPYFEGTAVAFKLEDIHTSLIQGQVTGAHLTGRMDYHQVSRNAFMNNPIFGSNQAGGHSKIQDILGSMGLLAFIPYIMMLYTSLRQYTIQIRNKELRFFLNFSYFLAGIYLYTKGLFGAPGYLFMLVIVPAVIIMTNENVISPMNKPQS